MKKKHKKHHDPVIHAEHKKHNTAHGLPPDVFAQPQDQMPPQGAPPTAQPMAPTLPMPMPGAAPQPPPM